MMETAEPNTVAVLCLAASIPITWWLLRGRSVSKDENPNSVPNAVGGSGLLGNALQYKEDPTGCIRQQEKATNSKIFRINMAGRKMIVVGADSDAMKQVASQPESVLSSCRAVAEIGFEYTLGSFNVYHGTAWHKKILKNYVMGDNFASSFLPGLFKRLSKSVDTEVKSLALAANDKRQDGLVAGPDLFVLVRRCVLRYTLDEFVSPLLLEKDPELLTALMVFQDSVEDTTAKAAVLPRFLALPSCLWRTERARKSAEARISHLLTDIWKSDESNWGPWTKAYSLDGTTPQQAAEHLIGLIFAGHKNPSIGATQAFCFLRKELGKEQQTQAQEEAKTLSEQFTSNSSSSSSLIEALLQAKTLRKCVLETMRLTAHTLGALRYANQDLEVHMSNPKRTYHIEKGSTVTLAHHTMHMESSLWGKDPQAFSLSRPEWNEPDDKENIGIPVDHYKLTTFSNGTHKCPGEKVALAIMQLQVALLLQKDAQIVGDLAPMSFERATLAQRDGPVPFTIRA